MYKFVSKMESASNKLLVIMLSLTFVYDWVFPTCLKYPSPIQTFKFVFLIFTKFFKEMYCKEFK